MPRFNGTGPQGQGALSGRRMGQCEGAEPGQGMGQGRMMRHRHQHRKNACNGFRLVGRKSQAIESLQSQIDLLQSQISDLKAQTNQ